MTDWHIAIETSGTNGSVALMFGHRVVESHDLESNRRTAAVLAPALTPLLEQVDRQGSALRFVSVTYGPGSFTGLRIGVTTAKTLAYARNTAVVPVDTLAVVASQIFAADLGLSEVVVGINAYRGQVFVRHERRDQGAEKGSEVWSSEKWKNFLEHIPKGVLIAGNADPSRLSQGTGDERSGPGTPTAVGLGRLAWERFRGGQAVDPMRVKPAYLRPSAAEEKAAAASAVNATKH